MSTRGLLLSAISLFVLARALGLHTLFLVEEQLRGTRPPVGPRFRGWTGLLSRWDAFYYEVIARSGYPPDLPLDAHGEVAQNVWAFFPAFPFAARGLATVTGLEFVSAAFVLNLMAGLMAVVALTLLVRSFAGDAAALRAATLWSFFPTAFVLQVPYSEAVYGAVAAASLFALVHRRIYWAAALLVLAGLTRGFVLPLSAAAIVWWWQERARTRHTRSGLAQPERTGEPPAVDGSPAVGRAAQVALLGAALTAPFLWMSIAAIVTGRADAYAATQRAWDYRFDSTRWLEGWERSLSRLGVDPLVTTVTLVLAACTVLLVGGLRARALPLALKAHLLCGVLLLFPMALPGSVAFGSVPRFAFSVLTLPIVLALVVRHHVAIIGVACGFIYLQYLWVLNVWSGRMSLAP